MSNPPGQSEASAQQAASPHGANAASGESDRRAFLSSSSLALMASGLAAGYGTFFAMAGRYFYPSGKNTAWLFVGEAEGIAPGQSKPFVSPTGVSVSITRRADSTVGLPLSGDSFLALSSVCPHLGCRVHWEPQNNRFFCPCHNGVFDPSGKAIGGPPAAAGQHLSNYSLQIVDGALYIEMPITSVGQIT